MTKIQFKPRKKKVLGSYPYLTSVFSIGLALFILGLFGLLLIYAGSLTDLIKENIEIQVYLEREISDASREAMGKELAEKPWVYAGGKTKAVRFISREEAARAFIAETGEDFVNFLGDNPLRDSYTIKVNHEYAEPQAIAQISKELENLPGVFEVKYVENVVQVVYANINRISFFLLLLAAVLVVGVAVIINNTIKLALYSQRFLIRSMQLVGARPWFIQRPFLYRALVQGLLGGLLASAALYLLRSYAYEQVPDLKLLHQAQQITLLQITVLFGGAALGVVSAYLAVNRYLKLSLDQLY